MSPYTERRPANLGRLGTGAPRGRGSESVNLALDRQHLSIFNPVTDTWDGVPGECIFQAGARSGDLS
jgi:hypothetical protein